MAALTATPIVVLVITATNQVTGKVTSPIDLYNLYACIYGHRQIVWRVTGSPVALYFAHVSSLLRFLPLSFTGEPVIVVVCVSHIYPS